MTHARARAFLALTLAFPLLATEAAAAGLTLKRIDGALGGTLQYDLAGDPGEAFIFILSLNAGPIPLSLVNPLDTRVLEVGLELQPLWGLSTLNGAGTFTLFYPLPNDPLLQGLSLHAQAITYPGSPFLVDDLSNPTGFRLCQHGKSTFAINERAGPIDGHTVTLLADGRVLLGGGTFLTAPGSGFDVATFELFDPQTQRFQPATGAMQHPRSAHTATRLADGRVLLLGGANGTNNIVATGDIWDPATGLATPIAPMSSPRLGHTATLLADGRVLVSGGTFHIDPADQFSPLNNTLKSTAVYDPVANAWSPGPDMPQKLIGHAASLLPNGQVLITGGIEITSLFGLPLPTYVATCRRYDPGTNSFVAAGPLPSARGFHAQLTRGDGSVVIAGGTRITGINPVVLADCARYTLGTNAFAAVAPMTSPRAYPQLVEAGAGLVAIGGLSVITQQSSTPATTIDVSNAALNVWTTPSSVLAVRTSATSVAIDGGKRVLTTGVPDGTTQKSAEIFLP